MPGPLTHFRLTHFLPLASNLHRILLLVSLERLEVTIVVKKSRFIAFAIFLFTGLANAQIPKGNVFFGYSYYNTDLSSIDRANTNGWEASLEGKIIPWVGIVADFDTHYGSQNFPANCPFGSLACSVNASFTERNFLFGPRVSVSVAKFRPFAEALFGGAHVSANNGIGSDTSFATALGGGLDYKIIPLVAWRFQGDYIQTRFFGATQDNVRLSTGIVVHF
jgi:opacity protein-like surface antigen